jgi:hypothetical protein
MRRPQPGQASTARSGTSRTGALWRVTFLLATAAWLAACSTTPVGVAPNLRGTYWGHAIVTNPNGGGPQVIRWGPPDPWFPDPMG